MIRFVKELQARLESAGFDTQQAQADALRINAGTWSRALRGRIRFSPQIIQAGLGMYPELAFFLTDANAHIRAVA